MLRSLSIKNVVLIDELTLDFSDSLTVLTGETGAGKSILLDSLALALGARSDVGLIRHGQNALSVVATFDFLENEVLSEIFDEQALEVENDIILRRVVYADGRSKAFVNDQPISISLLKKIGSQLVEIHGQFAVTALLNSSAHLGVLDAYGHLKADVEACRQAWYAWKKALEALKTTEAELQQIKADETYLKEALEDLEKLNPKPDEEEFLTQQRKCLINGEKIAESLSSTQQIFEHEDHGIMALLSKAIGRLEKADALADGIFDTALNDLDNVRDTLEAILQKVQEHGAAFADTNRLPEIDERLFALKTAARKHGVIVNELPAVIVSLQKKLDQFNTDTARLEQLRKQEADLKKIYDQKAGLLSKKRQETAQRLDKSVERELPALKLSGARFETKIMSSDMENAGPDGIDSVVFHVATNKGTELAPLHKAASGGELSRFMLALKVNLAAQGLIRCVVFDEVDSGIGGSTAEAVGRRLAHLGEMCQVLVITHSPQVAGFAKTHFCVSKYETSDSVKTKVDLLNRDQRLKEIARMLSGERLSVSAVKMADELLVKL